MLFHTFLHTYLKATGDQEFLESAVTLLCVPGAGDRASTLVSHAEARGAPRPARLARAMAYSEPFDPGPIQDLFGSAT